MPSIADSQTERFISRRHFALAATLATAAMLYGSWLPFQIREISLQEGLRQFRAIVEIGLTSNYSRQDVAVNFVAGVPLSFAILGSMLCRTGGMVRVLTSIALSAALSVGISCVAEFGQVWVEGRVPTMRDIAAQSVGATVGILLWMLTGRWLCDAIDNFVTGRQRSNRLQSLLSLYVAGFYIWSLLPFDLVTNINEIGRKLTRGEVEILPFSFPYPTTQALLHALMLDVILYVPVGVWASCVALRVGAPARNIYSAALLGALFSVGVEASQLLIRGRYSSTTDVLAGTLGSLAGILLARGILRRPKHLPAAKRQESTFELPAFWGLCALAYSAILLLVFWLPFEQIIQSGDVIRSRFRTFAGTPFQRLQTYSNDVTTLFVIIRNFAWFLPLGVLCAGAVRCATAVRSRQFVFLALAFLYIAGLGLAIELGQILMPSRVPDFTEVLLRLAGGLCGLLPAKLVFRGETGLAPPNRVRKRITTDSVSDHPPR